MCVCHRHRTSRNPLFGFFFPLSNKAVVLRQPRLQPCRGRKAKLQPSEIFFFPFSLLPSITSAVPIRPSFIQNRGSHHLVRLGWFAMRATLAGGSRPPSPGVPWPSAEPRRRLSLLCSRSQARWRPGQQEAPCRARHQSTSCNHFVTRGMLLFLIFPLEKPSKLLPFPRADSRLDPDPTQNPPLLLLPPLPFDPTPSHSGWL